MNRPRAGTMHRVAFIRQGEQAFRGLWEVVASNREHVFDAGHRPDEPRLLADICDRQRMAANSSSLMSSKAVTG